MSGHPCRSHHIESTQARASSGGPGPEVIAAPEYCDRVCEIRVDVPSWLQAKVFRNGTGWYLELTSLGLSSR
jgi:hypothetical protein